MIELTGPTRERLRQELAVLLRERAELSEGATVERADDYGDRAETLRRADDLARIDDRIRDINRLLVRGIATDRGGVALADGSRVTLRFEDGSVSTFYAAAITEEVPEDQQDDALSLSSPLGRALAGATEGNIVHYDTPDGPRQAEVLNIEPPNRTRP